jgi:ABC-type ATPase with predicted acetyltransferase domain
MIVKIDKTVPAFDSYAAERTRGLYNVDVEDGQRFRLEVDVPVETDDWQIGVVVGPSGSGKTSVARALELTSNLRVFHEFHNRFEYDGDAPPIIEALGKDDYSKATAALAAVGLGSVPSWLRPYHVLSNGEQFRAELADLLLSGESNVYVDEFTSVLDRQVAKVGAGAFAKAWRKQPKRKIVLLTPHYDILEWVQPDWWIDTADGLDEFAADRGVVVARKGDFQAASHRARHRGNRVVTLEC